MNEAVLQEKINNLHERMDELISNVKEIKIQTTKTNGRVTELEYIHKNCPVDTIAKETELIRMLVKYPKLFRGIVLIILSLISVSSISTIVELLMNI